MSGIRYSSLRYLLPLEVRGEAWSSRLRCRVMFMFVFMFLFLLVVVVVVLGVVYGDWRRVLVRVGSGWMGEGVA